MLYKDTFQKALDIQYKTLGINAVYNSNINITVIKKVENQLLRDQLESTFHSEQVGFFIKKQDIANPVRTDTILVESVLYDIDHKVPVSDFENFVVVSIA